VKTAPYTRRAAHPIGVPASDGFAELTNTSQWKPGARRDIGRDTE
jgi:hypothetical protein